MARSLATQIAENPLAYDAYDFLPEWPDLSPAYLDAVASDAERVRIGQRLAASRDLTWGTHQGSADYRRGRKALHRVLRGAFLSETVITASAHSDGERPRFVILGGRACSGKAWFAGRMFNPRNAVLFDADAIMAQLPEYDGLAPVVRAEAADILESMMDSARLMGLNVVVDATLCSLDGARAKIAAFAAAGYVTEAHYMFVPPQVAAERAAHRFDKTGHYVPIESVLANTANEQTFDLIRGRVDVWSFFDNDVPEGEEPKLIANSGGAGGTASPSP